MRKGLFLDDERVPSDITWPLVGSGRYYDKNIDWIIVRTLSDFLDEMNKGCYSYYSFDHDIQDFYVLEKGAPIAETAFGTVYAEETTKGENTGYDAAKRLKEYLKNFSSASMKGYYVHSKNPVGRDKIHNLLKDLI